jgi:hypothetical protein
MRKLASYFLLDVVKNCYNYLIFLKFFSITCRIILHFTAHVKGAKFHPLHESLCLKCKHFFVCTSAAIMYRALTVSGSRQFFTSSLSIFFLPFSTLGEYFLHLTLANVMLSYSFFSLTVPYLFASHSELT